MSLAIACALIASLASPVFAHRLDEYLQASQISVAKDRVTLDLYLTPGVLVAPAVIAEIDSNHDGSISELEKADYADKVLAALELLDDDKPCVLSLVKWDYTTADQMRQGLGAIHLRAVAHLPDQERGRHWLALRNVFEPAISVYLANAMVPQDSSITIRDQNRDYLQQAIDINYDIAMRRSLSTGSLEILLGAVVLIVAARFYYHWRTRRISPDLPRAAVLKG